MDVFQGNGKIKVPCFDPGEDLLQAGNNVIYRKQANGVMPLSPFAIVKSDATTFADPHMEHGVLYFYAVRTLVKIGSDLVESDLSNEAEGKFSLSE